MAQDFEGHSEPDFINESEDDDDVPADTGVNTGANTGNPSTDSATGPDYPFTTEPGTGPDNPFTTDSGTGPDRPFTTETGTGSDNPFNTRDFGTDPDVATTPTYTNAATGMGSDEVLSGLRQGSRGANYTSRSTQTQSNRKSPYTVANILRQSRTSRFITAGAGGFPLRVC